MPGQKTALKTIHISARLPLAAYPSLSFLFIVHLAHDRFALFSFPVGREDGDGEREKNGLVAVSGRARWRKIG